MNFKNKQQKKLRECAEWQKRAIISGMNQERLECLFGGRWHKCSEDTVLIDNMVYRVK